jgi:hypothetical protein
LHVEYRIETTETVREGDVVCLEDGKEKKAQPDGLPNKYSALRKAMALNAYRPVEMELKRCSNEPFSSSRFRVNALV